MNKLHLKWLFKPAWQLFLGQLVIWSIIGLIIHVLAWKTVWQVTISSKNALIARESEIEQYRQQLLSLPSLATINNKINKLLILQKECCDNNSTLLQRINESLSFSGGRLLVWQEKDSLIANNITSRHGSVGIEINYLGLILFLQEILSLQPPIQIKQMNISAGQNELTAEFELTEHLWEFDE